MNYKENLADKLTELKKIAGFPLGDDEDILDLSDPPFFTACPNPYILDFLKAQNNANNKIIKVPYINDVKAGKHHPIYTAHTYHTKVPHLAIEELIEYYTEKGDVVFDGFSGSGMTGVAAILKGRNAILNELSPFASFMSYCYTNNLNSFDFKEIFDEIKASVYKEYAWMFKTKHVDLELGEINYTVWSDIVQCNFCKNEFCIGDLNEDKPGGLVEKIICPNCSAILNENDYQRVKIEILDPFFKEKVFVVKQKPILISYTYKNKIFWKRPDEYDKSILNKIVNHKISAKIPISKIPVGDKTQELFNKGITYYHQLFEKRNLIILSSFKEKMFNVDKRLWFLISSLLPKASKLMALNGDYVGRIMKGTYYVAPIRQEINLFYYLKKNITSYLKALNELHKASGKCIVTTQSATDLRNIPDNSIDYIFTDPPFGSNLMYSELNYIWESFLNIYTNNEDEAIVNRTQNKNDNDYEVLMNQSFTEMYRILKPEKWITIEFHNTKSSIWNIIRHSITKAGFVISQVAILNKKIQSFNQINSSGAVGNDLIINAFKPSQHFEKLFIEKCGVNLEIDFVHLFLSNLEIRPSIDRTEKMLYSKLLAYYIQRGYEIRYDARSFYNMLNQNFVNEDGFWFTLDQINSYLEYRKKMKLEGIAEIKSGNMFLFITDEKSALVWMFNFLSEEKSFSDITIAFNQLVNIEGDIVPELRELLDQNFINENNKYRRPKSEPEHNQITEKREKALLKEFEILFIRAKTEKGKIKLARKEALLIGFEMCYKAKRFNDILAVANKLDKTILENSYELNDFIEASEIMVQGIS